MPKGVKAEEAESALAQHAKTQRENESARRRAHQDAAKHAENLIVHGPVSK